MLPANTSRCAELSTSTHVLAPPNTANASHVLSAKSSRTLFPIEKCLYCHHYPAIAVTHISAVPDSVKNVPGRLFCLVLLAAATALAAGRPTPVILDTDIGDDIDDALALSLALQSPELNVLAVSTVLQHGDARRDLVARILELYGRPEIPVGVGAERPLVAPPLHVPLVQASAIPPGFHAPGERRNGVELIIDTCLRSPEKVTILAYGPLTNIALALRAESRLRDKIERIVLMNGVFFRPGLEYNTMTDPEASAIVYSSGLPVETVGLDVTMQCQLTAAQLGRLEASTLPTVRFLMQLIHLWQGANPGHLPILHDPLAIAVTDRPGLVTLRAGRVEVETRGTPHETYGMSVFHPDPAGNVRVAEEVDSAGVVDFFLDRVLAPPRSIH